MKIQIRRLRYGIRKVESQLKKILSKKCEGFTYIETVAVIAIGAVLTAGSVFSATKLIATAKKTAARTQLEQFSYALQTYFLDCGRFPTTEQGLAALWEKPVLYPVPEDWDGPYLERRPAKDPWGTDFEYLSAESSVMPAEVPANLPYVLICYGADKEKGGKANGADIVSWE